MLLTSKQRGLTAWGVEGRGTMVESKDHGSRLAF